MKTHYLIIPGYEGSGPDHWQTRFEQTQPNFHRVMQRSWDFPVIDDWVTNLDKAVVSLDGSRVVLVAHSLGCLTVAEWSRRYKRNIHGALLVAPPDLNVLENKLERKLFHNLPDQTFEFKSILVGSTNDHWADIEKVKSYGRLWGSDFINIGAAGHINAQSGHGAWQEGLNILSALA